MEHGVPFANNFPNPPNQDQNGCDYNNVRYVGWEASSGDSQLTRSLYTKRNIDTISRKVTELTMGVHPDNIRIIVPDSNICMVIDGVWQSYAPLIGGIYTKDIMPMTGNYQGQGLLPENYVRDIVDRTIEAIVSQIRNVYGMMENNSKLTVWSTVLGDFNEQGLRSHSQIPVRNRKPQSMFFSMNY